jgi:hypothetical protein
MQEKVLLWGPSKFSTSLDLPASGISNPEGPRYGDLLLYKKVLPKFGDLWRFWENRRRQAAQPKHQSFSFTLSSSPVRDRSPEDSRFPRSLSLSLSLSLSPSRSSVCLSTARHTFPTYAHSLAPPSQHWGPVLWWTRVQDSNWEGNEIDPTKTVTTLNRKPVAMTNWQSGSSDNFFL